MRPGGAAQARGLPQLPPAPGGLLLLADELPDGAVPVLWLVAALPVAADAPPPGALLAPADAAGVASPPAGAAAAAPGPAPSGSGGSGRRPGSGVRSRGSASRFMSVRGGRISGGGSHPAPRRGVSASPAPGP